MRKNRLLSLKKSIRLLIKDYVYEMNEINNKFTSPNKFKFYLKGVLLHCKLPCKTSSQKIFIVVE